MVKGTRTRYEPHERLVHRCLWPQTERYDMVQLEAEIQHSLAPR